MPIDMTAVARAHGFMRVQRPLAPWPVDAGDEPFFRLLGEMIAAGLARNGGVLAELTLNISNVVIDAASAGALPAGEFAAITISGGGDWRPESTWSPAAPVFVTSDLAAAARAARIAGGYTRVASPDGGSVTVLLPRG